MSVDAKYKISATASGGGRDGKTALDDGTMSFDLVMPKELGGPGGNGANPEKLFALGYSACFLSAMRTA
jgi:lipoyl-dependent peroxiredoxin